jgi:hypothetical protein
MKYHPATRQALSRYAAKYLRLYRNHRKHGGDDPRTARWRANFVMRIGATMGNVYTIAQARYDRVTAVVWKDA